MKSGVRSLDLIQAMVTLGCLYRLNWAMVHLLAVHPSLTRL